MEGRGQHVWNRGIWRIDERIMKWMGGKLDGEGGEWRWRDFVCQRGANALTNAL